MWLGAKRPLTAFTVDELCQELTLGRLREALVTPAAAKRSSSRRPGLGDLVVGVRVGAAADLEDLRGLPELLSVALEASGEDDPPLFGVGLPGAVASSVISFG